MTTTILDSHLKLATLHRLWIIYDYIRSWLCSFHELHIYMYIRDCHRVFTDRVNVRVVLEPVSRKSRERFGSEKPVVKLQSACFGKMIF